ncbi:uncharacterized protein DUF1572 [Scopulibacillus darangshiensis]|uniref:Uncharacterized protein DUF1572 n=1 Tax=Scopulibacillus darangshiensis TaxID=442528 RepID=A0A4R2P512_9BACL|nr:DUF1572 family protein [Scopulibacillus darangshiensis]TCP29920.1 uncharacterized protein DUF1572 [Scopulibacillus darangshiensis]
MTLEQVYLENVHASFTSMKKLAEGAIDQLSFEELHYAPNSESNSIALLVKHMSGNMKSRFTSFLTTDGEKPDRDRDAEFEGGYESKDQLLDVWHEGWETVFQALSELKEGDLLRTVTIRSEPHTVLDALQRQIAHYSNHIGQIVYTGKAIKDGEWQCLSVPRGSSQEFTKKTKEKYV